MREALGETVRISLQRVGRAQQENAIVAMGDGDIARAKRNAPHR